MKDLVVLVHGSDFGGITEKTMVRKTEIRKEGTDDLDKLGLQTLSLSSLNSYRKTNLSATFGSPKITSTWNVRS